MNNTNQTAPTPDINWKALRDKYFAECVYRKVNGDIAVKLAPHDMFEWFKEQITGVPYIK